MKKSPWPTKATMQQVYQEKLWGDNGTDFYSGEGSHHPDLVVPYVEVVSNFLQSFKKPIKVCDLGCGDFNIGKQLLAYVKHYVAVDIVPELIDFNENTYDSPHLEFHSLDIAKDELPQGDCAILRQVLQHLSNAEVGKVVEKLYRYRYIILTEHLPEGEFEPNKDIVSGQGIRLKKQSGLDLLQPPFSMKVKETKILLTQSPITHQGVIITNLFQTY